MRIMLPAIVASLTALVLCAHPAAAVPPRLAVAPPRIAPVRTLRAPVVHALRYRVAPLLGANLVRHVVTAPIRALPLIVRPQPVVRFASILPRLGLAIALAPLGSSACAAARRRTPVDALPTTPFVLDECSARAAWADDRSLPATSLVAGHNKNALYGPAFAPGTTDFRY